MSEDRGGPGVFIVDREHQECASMIANLSTVGYRASEEPDDLARLTTKNLPEGWTELDQRAVDTARVLAADA
ncbi:hypothetical protein ACWDKQ_35740, partial [Saccharopolyspora sp. NPDC000995]